MQVGGPRCKGLIVEDGGWLYARDLELFHADQTQKVTVALVIGEKRFGWCEHAPSVISRILKEYEGLVDYALITPKMRMGTYDLSWLDGCVRRIYDDHPWLGLAVARVPGPDSLGILQPIITKCPEVGLVAGETVQSSDGKVDPHKMRNFFLRATSMYNLLARAA